MTTIKILGSGCAKCKTLHARVQEVVVAHDVAATVVKVEELRDIMSYGILSTPGLVINEKVKSTGTLPSAEQILTWINEG